MQHIKGDSKYIIASDLHLRKYIWPDRREIVNDNINSFHSIIDICIDKKANLILLGDTFDSAFPDSEIIHEFCDGIYKLFNNNLKLFTLKGNHDNVTPPWPEALFGEKIYQDKIICAPCMIETLHWQIYLFNFNEIPNNFEKSEKNTMLLGHQTLDLFMKINYNYKHESLVNKFDVVILGDYHKPVKVKVENTTFASIGSCSLNNWGEDHLPVVMFFNEEKSEKPLSLIKVKSRERKTIELNEGEVDKVISEIQDFVQNKDILPLVRISYTEYSGVQDDIKKISTLFKGKCHFFTKKNSNNEEIKDIDFKIQNNIFDIDTNTILESIIDKNNVSLLEKAKSITNVIKRNFSSKDIIAIAKE